jgi:hypothetical protein
MSASLEFTHLERIKNLRVPHIGKASLWEFLSLFILFIVGTNSGGITEIHYEAEYL